MSLKVRHLTADDGPRWDEFVSRHPHGSPFHLVAWKTSIEATFRFRPVYLLAVDGTQIRAVLPVFLVKTLLLGKVLLSSPFAVYGGILADSPESRDAIRQHLQSLAHSLNVDHVELRNAYPELCVGFAGVDRYVTFTQNIGPDADALLNAIPRKTRYMVRKALRHPFSTRVASDPKNFQDLYSQNLRRLGTPSFPPRHFSTLLRNFQEKADIREVLLHGKVVAAVMTFYFRDQVLPYYGASDPDYNDFAPNNYMYFDLMRWGGQNGYRLFDFGRSKVASGSFDFKAHWGMTQKTLPYEILLVRRKSLPNYSPQNPGFQLPIKVWQKLPLPLTRALGPVFLKMVP